MAKPGAQEPDPASAWGIEPGRLPRATLDTGSLCLWLDNRERKIPLLVVTRAKIPTTGRAFAHLSPATGCIGLCCILFFTGLPYYEAINWVPMKLTKPL